MTVLTRLLTATCEQTGPRLPALVDGDLRPLARLRVRRHLAVCPGCRRMLDLMVRGISALGTLGSASAERSVAADVLARLDDPGDPPGQAPRAGP